LPRKICCPLIKKVRIPKKDQVLDLFLKKESKVTNRQGEQLLKPVWNKTREMSQKQVPEQACKQALVQDQKLGPEQLQNSVLQKTEQEKKVWLWIHQPHMHGNIIDLAPLIKLSLI